MMFSNTTCSSLPIVTAIVALDLENTGVFPKTTLLTKSPCYILFFHIAFAILFPCTEVRRLKLRYFTYLGTLPSLWSIEADVAELFKAEAKRDRVEPVKYNFG